MHIAHLTSRMIMRLSGSDTLAFLQGLVTNDVLRLETERSQYALMLTPQGKFLFGFFLYWHEGDVLLDVNQQYAEPLLKRLMMYRLRSKVDMALTPLQVVVHWGDAAAGQFHDPRLSALGFRSVGDTLSSEVNASEAEYDRMRLMLSVPDEALDLIPEKSFPLPFGFEDLHAVDFRKGCYVGQEVTARSKHLGTLRKALYQVRSNGALPPLGTPLHGAQGPAGEMLSSCGDVGLALLQVPLVSETLHYDGGSLTVLIPIWFKNRPVA